MKNDRLTSTVNTIAGECLAVRIRLLNRTVTNIFDDALRPLGVKVSQLNVLIVVARLGPISPGDVAKRLNMEKSTLSRNVDRMRAHGWLKVSSGDTGRQQKLSIGAAGRKIIEEALPLWKKAQAEAEAMLGKQGARSIHRAVDNVRAQLGQN
jgi:DNA-binding MarR family transcriptional regulator